MRMGRRSTLGAAFSLSVLGLFSPEPLRDGCWGPMLAHAEESSPSSPPSPHEALLDQGFAALRAQRPAEALLLFRKARFMSVSARTVGAMGLAEEALAHWVDAEQDLSQALAYTQDPWVKAEKEHLTAALERVEAHVGALFVTGCPAGTVVMIGDRSLVRLPMGKPVRLAAGKLHLALVPPAGFSSVESDVELPAGSPTAVALSCPVQPTPPRTSPSS